MKRIHGHKRMNRLAKQASLVPAEGVVGNLWQWPQELGLFRTLREPGLDITDTGNKVTIKAELPGMAEKDIKVSIEENILTISGEKSAKREVKKSDYYFLETNSSAIRRSVRLPEGIIKHSKLTHFKNGHMTIEFDKK